jgi:hypothetical protein
LQLGQQARLKIEGIHEPRIAKITRINPTVEEMSRSLAFEAVVDNRDGSLRTGLFAEAEVMVDPAAQSLIVPPAAIMEFAGAEKVWKLINGVAKETVVRTARHGERGVEIVAGLAAGDLILAKATEGRVARVDGIPETIQSHVVDTTQAVAAEQLEPPEPLTPTSAGADR